MTRASDSPLELAQFHGGLKLDGHKQASTRSPIALLPAQTHYTIPMLQHIGKAGEVLVQVGERVRKGQMLAQAKHLLSAPVHAPVSGTVHAIDEYPVPHPSGLNAICIVITNDFQDTWVTRTPVADHAYQMTPTALRRLIRDAGIVGLGGAGFPTAIKQTEIDIKTLIINGVECEPYITCDDMLMRERAREIITGADIIGHIIKAREVIIAIEDNKPEAIAAMQAAIADDITDYFRVQVVPTIYPSGGEKQLIKMVLDKEVPINGLPNDIGVLCQNVATAYAIYRTIYHDEPVISRIVTITGPGVTQAQNLEVAIGTSMQACLDFCGTAKDASSDIIMGGPMMGFALNGTQLPVIKVTNCLLVNSEADSSLPAKASYLPCIRCGRCVDVCPANLLPQQLYWYAAARDFEHVVDYHLFDCIECGCCSYVCPSQIPLVQYYRYAKSEIWEQERQRKQADIARERHEAHQARLEKQKIEREEKLRVKREALKARPAAVATNADTGKSAAIAAALARVAAKKKQQALSPKNIDNLSSEQQQLIEAVEKRRQQSREQNT